MPLVFAAVTPHPLFLIPSIGKGAEESLVETQRALRILEEDMYVSRPHTIVIISPHGGLYTDAFTLNAHTTLEANFVQFGDLTTTKTWRGAPEFAAKISHEASRRQLPVRSISQELLDHGASVPLFSLTTHLPEARVLPVGFSGLPSKQHLDFGELLKDMIMESDKRIAVIASGDMSHCLSKNSPAPFCPAGKQYDAELVSLLETRNTTGLTNMNEQLIRDAEQCNYRSVLILLGILKNMDYQFKNLCYEAPFGVGYLTGQFVF